MPLHLGVGPISLAYTDVVGDLLSFYDNVRALTANGGGDIPEYSLDGMLKGLQFQYMDDYGTVLDVMVEGSQMIVLTDAPSKNEVLESTVIEFANRIGVCIHCFVVDNYGTDDGLYQRVAEGTSGQLVTPFSNWDIANFASSYRTSPCNYEIKEKRRKRSATAPALKCHSFHVSKLSILFRFSGESLSSVTLTRPSGTIIVVPLNAGVAVHSERNPESGEWLACLISGTLEFSVDQDYSFDATIGYLKKTSSGNLVASISPPVECEYHFRVMHVVKQNYFILHNYAYVYTCKYCIYIGSTGQIVLSSLRSALIVQPVLSMLDNDRNVVQTVHMEKCSGALVGNMSFPRGEYTYSLEGVDTSGVSISYHISKKIEFKTGEYELVNNGDNIIEIERSDTFNFSLSISNMNSYTSVFAISVQSPGFIARLQNTSVSLLPGEIANIVVVSWVSSSSVLKGSTNTFEIKASNGCATLTATKTVMIKV